MQLGSHICTLESARECEGMNPHTPKWTPILEVGIPYFHRIILRVKTHLIEDLFIPLESSLRLICLKWACMIHLSTYNTSYGQKEGRKLKCQFDSWPLKVKNYSKIRAFRWRVIYICKAFDKGYNFAVESISIGGLHKKLWASKVAGVPISGFSELPT
jgi:hypothetical protein